MTHIDVFSRPILRGISHLVGFFASLVSGTFLVLAATAAAQLVASIIYGAGLALALGTSAAYHRIRWSKRLHPIIARIDHSMIFVLVASSFTPFLLLRLNGAWRLWSLIGIWSIAAIGITLRLIFPSLPRVLLVGLYLTMGWSAAALFPQLYGKLPTSSMTLLIVGGGLYSLGALVYLFKRPDPLPKIFGFHEIFHALVIAAATCHYAAIWPLVTHQISV